MQQLVILGAAESGVGAAILAQQKGYSVFVSDMGTIKERYKAQLDAHALAWEEGRHTAERILAADLVIKSPGIPDDAPMVRQVREKGIEVISEIEFAGRYTTARKICITGSNGKTTTTSLIYHILERAGFNVGLAGNIGRSMALQVAEGDKDWYVIELSSFQLDDMFDFRAEVAVLLNITPDHLDRYNFEMQRYVHSKMRITRNQQAGDSFIYWMGDDYIPSQLDTHIG
ncbi:MAG: Mur ligase family protein, partial [Bacteroidales bacterium]|nr:Mur ligase family protein [Bacteroidales bacterium]